MTILLRFTNLSLPCPENRLYRAYLRPGTKFPVNIRTKEGREKGAHLCGEMRAQMKHPPKITGPVMVSVTWTPRNKRMCDVFAYNKQIMDCLQKVGVVIDDKQIVAGPTERMPVPDGVGSLSVTVEEVPE
jgi:Holliday junction resolvase RusA-like endonuclease